MLKSLYFVLGDDHFAQREFVEKLTQKALAEEWREINTERLNNEHPVSAVLDAWLTPVFWGDRRVVVAERSGDELLQLITHLGEHYADALPETPNILLVLADKLDRRKKGLKKLLQQAQIEEFAEIKRWNIEKELFPWIEAQLKQQGKRMTRTAMAYLVTACGTDKYTLLHNLDKILLYLDTGELIEQELVQKLVPASDADIFQLLDHVADRQAEACFSQLNQLLLREPANKVMYTLGSSINSLFQARQASQLGKSHQEIGKALGQHPFVVKKNLERWRRYSLRELHQGLQRLLDLQTRTRQSRLKPELALEMWLGDMLNV